MDELKEKLRAWAKEYNTTDFIPNDPIQFPTNYIGNKKDVEISGFVTSWISFGNRRSIIDKANYIDNEIFQGKPFDYIASKKWEEYKGETKKIYRFFSYDDFYQLCWKLYYVYDNHDSLEDAIKQLRFVSPLCALISIFGDINGIPFQNLCACKRLCMFLRWMVRNDGIVDIGIWNLISPNDLIMPVDVHVHQMALQLGITKRNLVNMKTAVEITDYMRSVFPGDPCLGDFALFGYGVTHKV